MKISPDLDHAKRAAFIHSSLPCEELIEVFGEIDISNELEFEESIVELAAFKRPVVVDLTACTYLDSRAAGVLIKSSRSVQIRVIAPVRGNIERVFKILRLSDVVPVEFQPRTSDSARSPTVV